MTKPEIAAFVAVCGLCLLAGVLLWLRRARKNTDSGAERAFLNSFNAIFSQSVVDLEEARQRLPLIAQQFSQKPDGSASGNSEIGERQTFGDGGEVAPDGLVLAATQRLGSALEVGLQLAASSRSWPQVEERLRIATKLRQILELFRKIETEDARGNSNDADRVIDLCFAEGGFDPLLALPGFLDAYFRRDSGFTALRSATAVMQAHVMLLGLRRKIEIDVPQPLVIISRNDPRISGNDVRQISRIDTVSAIVDRISVSIHPDQALVVDCPVAQVIQNGQLLRKGVVVVYSRSAWV
ncbi:MAG: hypothetical protein R3D32_01255 [Nitratireductor sp.]